MKNVLVLCVCFAAALVLGTSDAGAAGFGIYGSAGSGTGDWTRNEGSLTEYDFKANAGHQGVGFMFDTAVARDSFFNYQLNLGYDKFTNKAIITGNKLDLGGLLISNSFGFGIVRTGNLRVWMGPEIRLAWPTGSKAGYDYEMFGGGIGPVIGMNFNFPGTFTVAVKVGYQFMNYTGNADSTAPGVLSVDYDAKERLLYMNIGFMFRSTGDVF